jgi:membrane-bound ClpP family serine protease
MTISSTLVKYSLLFSGCFLFVAALRDSLLTGRVALAVLGILMFLTGYLIRVPTEEKESRIFAAFMVSAALVAAAVYLLGYVA